MSEIPAYYTQVTEYNADTAHALNLELENARAKYNACTITPYPSNVTDAEIAVEKLSTTFDAVKNAVSGEVSHMLALAVEQASMELEDLKQRVLVPYVAKNITEKEAHANALRVMNRAEKDHSAYELHNNNLRVGGGPIKNKFLAGERIAY